MHFHLKLLFRLLLVVAIMAVLGVTSLSVGAQSNSIPDADLALLNGDYATAVAKYTAAVSDASLKCDALYGLGVAQYRAENYLEAVNALTQELNECERTFRAYVMYAQTLHQLGHDEDALAAYQAAQAIDPSLNSYLYERMAELAPDQSVYFLRLATEAQREPEGKFDLREKLAKVYLLIGSPSSAVAEYDALLQEVDAYLAALSQVAGAEFDKDGSLRARIQLAAAEVQIDEGQTDAAYARLQKIITDYWQTPSALPALIDLVGANQTVDLLQRMRINVLNQNYTPVVSVLSDYLKTAGTSAPAELYLLLGEAQLGNGDTASAQATFAAIPKQYPTDPVAATAVYDEGNTYLQAQDYPNAIAAYTAVATAYPQAPEAPKALLSAADLQRDHGDLNKAVALYTQLSTQYGTSDEAKDGLFNAALLLRATAPTQAIDFFGKVGTSRGFVWQGKLLAQAGKTDEAKQAWQKGIAAEPGTYFSIRACELANGQNSMNNAPIVSVDTSGDKAAAEAWVAQTFNLQNVSADISPDLANDPLLKRGMELWSVGMWSDARAEFDALHKQRRDDPVALLQLAFYYQNAQIYRSSLLAATRLIYIKDDISILTIPHAILRLAFPIHFSDLLLPLSQQNGLDPLLVAALIRQESSFDPTVISVANARGLMQFVPATAQDMANQLNWPDYKLDDLYRPMVSIAFGTHYLSAMREYQGGSDVGAMLSYNAGPGIAKQWLDRAGGDLEALYETIDYSESQSYLDFIYTNHFIYQQLYTANPPTC